MIAVVNYGLGNLHSVHKAVAYVGGEAVVTDNPDRITKADKIILPGVGAFQDGMNGLQSMGLISVIKEAARTGKPILGICLGMQLLFEEGFELGRHPGLGLIPGKVIHFDGPRIKIPQIGWNQVRQVKESSLFNGIQNEEYFYFNHSYFCIPDQESAVLTTTTYGASLASGVQKANLIGLQFHPEKSQRIGLKILQNFVES